MDTEGLICFTNDGELAHRMTHPKYELPKTYIVTLDHPLTESLRQRILDQKVSLEDGPTPKCNLATEDVI
jgi:23S rRNA pseudouridine2605 synthase